MSAILGRTLLSRFPLNPVVSVARLSGRFSNQSWRRFLKFRLPLAKR